MARTGRARLRQLRLPMKRSGDHRALRFGGYSHRDGTGNGYRRYFDSARNWRRFIRWASCPRSTKGGRLLRRGRGPRGGVGLELRPRGAEFGHNDFDYNITTRTTHPRSLPRRSLRSGPDRILGTADDHGSPNKTSFFAGRVLREEFVSRTQRGHPGGRARPSGQR